MNVNNIFDASWITVNILFNKIQLHNNRLYDFRRDGECCAQMKQLLYILKAETDDIENCKVVLNKENYSYLVINGNEINLKKIYNLLTSNNVNIFSFIELLKIVPAMSLNHSYFKILNNEMKHYAETYKGLNLFKRIKLRKNVVVQLKKQLHFEKKISFQTFQTYIKKYNFLSDIVNDFLKFDKKHHGDIITAPYLHAKNIRILYDSVIKHKNSIKGCWNINIKGGVCKPIKFNCKKKKYLCSNIKQCGPRYNQDCFKCDYFIENKCIYNKKTFCKKKCSLNYTQVPEFSILYKIPDNFWFAFQDYFNVILAMTDIDEKDDEETNKIINDTDDEDDEKIRKDKIEKKYIVVSILFLIVLVCLLAIFKK
jgi:hypothetical protein